MRDGVTVCLSKAKCRHKYVLFLLAVFSKDGTKWREMEDVMLLVCNNTLQLNIGIDLMFFHLPPLH
jgi:hypothetical protein